MGRNCPAEAMSFDGMVRQNLIICIMLPMLANECSRSGFTDYTLGVAHNTSRILATIANFSTRSDSDSAAHWYVLDK